MIGKGRNICIQFCVFFFNTTQNLNKWLWICKLYKHHLCPSHRRLLGMPSMKERQWHPTPVLLPGKSHGRRSLVGCSPWGREELDTTERLHFHFSLSCIREGNGNPLQCSCLENPKDGGAWWATVYGVAQSQTWLKRLSSSSMKENIGCYSMVRSERKQERWNTGHKWLEVITRESASELSAQSTSLPWYINILRLLAYYIMKYWYN